MLQENHAFTVYIMFFIELGVPNRYFEKINVQNSLFGGRERGGGGHTKHSLIHPFF